MVGRGWEYVFLLLIIFQGKKEEGRAKPEEATTVREVCQPVQWVEIVAAALLRKVFEEESRSSMSHRAQVSLGQKIGRRKRKPTFLIL